MLNKCVRERVKAELREEVVRAWPCWWVGAEAALAPAHSPGGSLCPSAPPNSILVLLVFIVTEELNREPGSGLRLRLARGTLSERSPSQFFMSLIGDLQTLK